MHFLVFLTLPILLANMGFAFMGKDLSKITWTNSLASKSDLDAYLKGPHRMAHDTVTMDSAKKNAVLGSNPSGELLFADCIRTIKSRRTDHELKLEIKSLEVFEALVGTLAQLGEKDDWITLHLDLFAGPAGGVPKVNAEDAASILEKWPAKALRLSLGMATGKGPVKGYMGDMLQKMAEELMKGPFSKLTNMEFVLDIFHMSRTERLVGEAVLAKLKLVQRIELRLEKASEGQVDMKKFKSFMEKLEAENCYFNVPDSFRYAIFGGAPPETETAQNTPEINRGPSLGFCAVRLVYLLGFWAIWKNL